MSRGLFISLEGVEGSGKSTQLPRLADFLESRGWPCVLTREPGGTRIGRKIRAILLDPQNTDLAPWTELLLYEADRAQHVHTFIKPHLENGVSVLCDRFSDATTVYQGMVRGLDISRISALHQWICGSLSPDLTMVLDLPVQTGLARARARLEASKRPEGRFEAEALDFHNKVRQGYLKLAAAHPQRFTIIKANRPVEEVTRQIIDAASRLL